MARVDRARRRLGRRGRAPDGARAARTGRSAARRAVDDRAGGARGDRGGGRLRRRRLRRARNRARGCAMRFVLVDNYDSFTFNLFQMLADLNGEAPLLLRNDDPVAWPALRTQGYGAIVVSPGPGRPERERDFGISVLAIRESGMAVLGVCLGHQGICQLHGAPVLPAPVPMHGRLSAVHHAQIDLFEGIPSPFDVVRYHSLVVGDLPAGLHALAWADDGVLMAVRHLDKPLWGVQFHPESICSEHGARLLRNFRDLALAASTSPPARARLRGDERLVRRQPVVRWRKLALTLDAETVFAELYADREVAFWLDSSAAGVEHCGRFSFMGDDAGPLAEVLTYDVTSGRATIRTARGVEQADGPLLAYLDDQIRARRATTGALPFDFNGGYLGYELKAECGGDAAHRAQAPDAALMFADRFVAFDHERGEQWLVALEAHDAPAAPWLDAMAARLTALASSDGVARRDGDGHGAARVAPHADGGRAVHVEDAWPDGCAPRHDDDAYLALVERCQQAITAGETYEVCLTNHVELAAAIDPWTAYRRLRAVNPAPFVAFLRFADVSVLSASPERFLRVGADGAVEAKPIKGTAPRGASVEQDLAIRERLHASEKDRAE